MDLGVSDAALASVEAGRWAGQNKRRTDDGAEDDLEEGDEEDQEAQAAVRREEVPTGRTALRRLVKELVRSARASEGREGQERTHRDAEGKRDEDDWAAQAGLQNPVQPDPPAEVLPREPPDELCGCASRVESQRPRADAHDRQSEAGRTTPTGNRTIMPTPPRTACATIVRCCGVHSLAESAPPAATVCVGISVASVLVPAARRGRCSRGSAAVRPSSEVGARGTHWTSACPCARSPSSRPRPSSRAR